MPSEHRLIVELPSPAAAEAMRAELETFFAEHAKAYDAAAAKDDFVWPGAATDVARAFGEKYRHAWKEVLVWGDEQLEGDEPKVAALGDDVVLFHG